ncbi:MAG: hypothetical protein DDT34_00429 [Firmicutes bacterium]|nr:hypothetical protein [Bacillota bacterium]MBT9157556.1 hypothetical protein [Bacillota bacterium]
MTVNVAMFIDYENVYWSTKNSYGFTPETGRLVDGLERSCMLFVGLKLLTNRVLGSLADPQKVVSRAINDGILETYKVPNPVNADFPTTACRLNREHPFVQEILRVAAS